MEKKHREREKNSVHAVKKEAVVSPETEGQEKDKASIMATESREISKKIRSRRLKSSNDG